MTYIALTFWLLIIVLTAWGVHQLWSGMVKPKVLNTLLLPGTLVALIGHVLGLLITGATITNTTLYKNDESGAPENTPHPDPKIPVLGPVIIGLLPLLACAIAIYFVARAFGGSILGGLSGIGVAPDLPVSIAAYWDLLRALVSLVEGFVASIARADLARWQTWMFIYLLVCLAVRCAPFPGNLRGALGAIVVLGVAGATLQAFAAVDDLRVRNAWAVLNLTLAALLLLLLISLLIRGTIGLIQLLRSESS